MQQKDFEDFKQTWKLVFSYYNPDRREFDRDSDIYFKFMPKEFTLDDIKAGVNYVIQHYKYYPMLSEFIEAINQANFFKFARRKLEKEDRLRKEYEQQEEERRRVWESMTPEEKAEDKRRCEEAIDRLTEKLSKSQL